MNIQRCLNDIRKYLSEKREKENCKLNIQLLCTHFTEKSGTSNIDEFYELFDEANGIISFMRYLKFSELDDKEIYVEILSFFVTLVNQCENHISPYLPKIVNECKGRIEFNNTVVAKIFELLIQILKMQQKNLSQDTIFGLNATIPNATAFIDGGHLSNGVQKALEFIGAMIENFPEKFVQLKSNIFRMIVKKLKETMKKLENRSENSSRIVEGCFNALDPLFTHHGYILENENDRECIYSNLKKILAPDNSGRKYGAKACLNVLKNNCNVFFDLMYSDYKQFWSRTLYSLQKLSHLNKLVIEVLYSFYTHVSKDSNEAILYERPDILQFILIEMKTMLLTEDDDNRLTTLAIATLGKLTNVCKGHKQLQHVDILKLLLEGLEERRLRSVANINAVDFLYGVSEIARSNVYVMTEDDFVILEKLSIEIIESYPNLYKEKQTHVRKSLVKAIFNIAVYNLEFLENYLSKIVYIGIIKSCRHLLDDEVMFLKEISNSAEIQTAISYRAYVSLWIDFCAIENIPNLDDELREDTRLKSLIATRLYNKFVQCVLEIMHKLDLNPVLDNINNTNVKTDHLVFLNLVDLFVSVIPYTDLDRFTKWIPSFISYITSTRTLFKSGFYKLFTMIFKIMAKVNYFEDSTPLLETDIQLILTFLRNVLQHMQEYIESDLICCLYMVINTPPVCVYSILSHMDIVYKMIFIVGLTDLQLIRDSLSSLMNWKSCLSEEEFSCMLKCVLPNVITILQIKEFTGDAIQTTKYEAELLKPISKNRKTKTPHKLNRLEDVTQIQKLQKEIVNFLGKISTETCLSVLKSDVGELWDSSDNMRFELPFIDMKITLYLDSLLPYIIDLALNSADYKTRIIACELLHGCTIILAKNCSNYTKNNDPPVLIFKKVVSAIFKLGSDTNGTIQQLFQPLSFQLIHLYTVFPNPFVCIILDVIFDGIVNDWDGMLRKFCLECLIEFVSWSLKKNVKSGIQHADDVKIVVERICMFSVNPSLFRRLGSALAFNSIYTILREYEYIVDEFWFELLYSFVTSLKLNDDRAEQDDVCISALSHVRRVLFEKSSFFCKPSNIRRKPVPFEGVTLKDAVCWILTNCTSCNVACRKQCMDFVSTMMPKITIDGIFVLKCVEALLQTESLMVIVNMDEKMTLNNYVPNNFTSVGEDVLQHVLASLDCFIWLLRSNSLLISNHRMRSRFSSLIKISNQFVWKNIKSYVECQFEIDDADIKVPVVRANNATCNINDRIVIRIFELTTVLENDFSSYGDVRIFRESTLNVIIEYVFNPPVISDSCEDEHFRNIMKNLLASLRINLDAYTQNLFTRKLLKMSRSYINQFELSLSQVIFKQTGIPLESRQYLKWLYILYNSRYLFTPLFEEKFMIPNFVDLIFHNITVNNTAFQPYLTDLPWLESVLEFSFLHDEQIRSLLTKLSNTTKINSEDATNLSKTKGEHFLMLFKNSILNHLLRHQMLSFNNLLRGDNYEKAEYEQRIRLFRSCLQHMQNLKRNNGNLDITVLKRCVNSRWQFLQEFGSQNEHSIRLIVMVFTDIVSLETDPVGCLRNTDSLIMFEWLLTYIKRNDISKFIKSKLLDLLPCFCALEYDATYDEHLQDSLKVLTVEYFSPVSSDLTENSGEYITYKVLFSKILYTLETSCCSTILRYIIDVVAADPEHRLQEEIFNSFQNFIIKLNERLSIDEQVEILRIPFDNSQIKLEGALGVVKFCLVPMLLAADPVTVKLFFLNNIETMRSTLTRPFETRSPLLKSQIISKHSVCVLLETMCICIPSDIHGNNSDFIQKFGCKNFTSEVASWVLRFTREYKIEIHAKEKQRYRQFLCAACNVFVVLVQYVSKDLVKIEYITYDIFRRLVDVDKRFKFSMEPEELPKKMNYFIRKRKDIKTSRIGDQTIPSQYLSYSSLAEDVIKFDMTGCCVRAESFIDTERNDTESSIKLEMVDFNDHECMQRLCDFLLYAHEENERHRQISTSLSRLMTYILDVLNKSEYINVKLFIIKVIYNCNHVFRPYARDFLQSIMNILVCDKYFGNNMNYFFADTIIMLLEWSQIARPTQEPERKLATDILIRLISVADSENSNILNYNMELIEFYIKEWGSCLNQISCQFLLVQPYRIFCRLSKCFLWNDIVPYDEENRTLYIAKLFGGIREEINNPGGGFFAEKRIIYGFEAVRKIVKYLKRDIDDRNGNDECLRYITEELLNTFESINVLDYLKLLIIDFPELLHKFETRIIEAFLDGSVGIKIKCYKIFSELPTELNMPIFNRLGFKNIQTCLRENDHQLQVFTLKFVIKFIDRLSKEAIDELYGYLEILVSSESIECRDAVYKVVQRIYKRCCNDGLGSDNMLIVKVKKMLMKAVFDNDVDLQDSVIKFWKDELKQSSKILDRLRTLFDLFYMPETEDLFLSYSIYLLLEASSLTPDYQSNIFVDAKSECSYQVQKIFSSWRTKNLCSATMVTGSVINRLSLMSYTTDSVNFQIKGRINNFVFQPTLNSVDKSENVMDRPTRLLPTFTSSFFTVTSDNISGPYKYAPRKVEPVMSSSESSFKKPADKEDGTVPYQYSIKKLRQRLTLNTDRVKRYFAVRNIRRNEQREIVQHERQQKKEVDVKFCRTYRIGDYPDLEIKNSDIIYPLQVLARRSPLIAKEMLVLLFNGVYNTDFAYKSDTFRMMVQNIVNKILLSDTRREESPLNVILKIAYKHLESVDCSAELVSSVSQLCGQPALGCLLLEKMLTKEKEPEEPDLLVSKRRNSEETKDDIWIKLARLYDCLEETDVVNGILGDKINSSVARRLFEACKLQQNEKWEDSLKLYKRNFDHISLCDVQDQSLIFNSYAKCASYLSEWDDINRVIRTNISGKPDQLWNNAWCIDHVLPWLFASETHIILKYNRDPHNFLQQVNSWLLEDNKKTTLIHSVGEHLCMLLVYQDKSPKGLSICNEYINNIIDEWTYLGTSLEILKCQKVLDLQVISEISNILEIVNGNTQQICENAKDLLKLWNKNLPDKNDPLVFWDKRILYRNYFMTWLKKYCDDEQFLKELKCCKLKSRLSIINCSIHQRNIQMAAKYMKKRSEESIFKIYRSKLKLLVGEIIYHQEPENMLSHTFKSWDLLDDIGPECDGYDLRCHLFNIHSKILQILHTNKTLNLPDYVKSSFEKRVCDFSDGLDNVAATLKTSMMESIYSCVNEEEDRGHFKKASLVYLSIAKYIGKYGDETDVFDQERIIRSILRAMKYDLPEACQLFPTLLQLPQLNSYSVRKVFIEECLEIEEWKFLAWVNQLMAYVDTNIAAVIKPILIRIAKSYPQSLQLPFLLSSETFSRTNSDSILLENELRSYLTRDNKLQTLIEALSYVCLPHIALQNYLRKLTASVKNNFRDFETIITSLINHLFNENKNRGKIYDYLKAYERIIRVELVNDFHAGKPEDALRRIHSLSNEIDDLSKAIRPESSLESYSPWLIHRSSDQLLDIELPGQYTGLSKPMPEYHVKIFSFKPIVEPIQSLRRPIKISIVGNDARVYSYLNKFDEDLRQDNRIQQLFKMMNSSMSRDHACQRRKLTLVTFEVIPLKCNLGLIQWIEDAVSLDEFLMYKFSCTERSKYQSISDMLRNDHFLWIKTSSTGADNDFNNAIMQRDRASTVAQFKRLSDRIPFSIYRRALLLLAGNLETFLTIRTRFMASYSTMSMCHWILGIGDRHPKNTMVSLRSGHCVGIDFGHAFGTATECLPVPELIPFRMTPHIQHIMEPLFLTGLIRETMLHCLTALSRDNHTLLCAMQVFVQEPSVHWQRNTDLRPLSNSDKIKTQSDIPDIKWYPKQKIDVVRYKLQGISSPTRLLCDELIKNPVLKEIYKEKYCQLIRGDESRIRYKTKQKLLTHSEQVDHLLDLSTDEYVLGLSYTGLQLWL